MKGILLAIAVVVTVVVAFSAQMRVAPRGSGITSGAVPTNPRPKVADKKRDGGARARPIALGGTEFNDRRAVLEYQEQSAAKGNAQAQYVMALRYLKGIEVPQNEDKAMELLILARTGGELRARDKMLEIARAKRKAAAEVREARERAFVAAAGAADSLR